MNSGVPGGASAFGRAFDLSSLRKPTVELPEEALGFVTRQSNLVNEVLPISNASVVILICWSPRSAQSQELLKVISKLQADDSTKSWVFASLDVDAEPEVAQALQVKAVPYALALVAEQLVPLFEAMPPLAQIQSVIDKVVKLAAEKGVGQAPAEDTLAEEKLEPEEELAMAALENEDYDGARAAYQTWLNRSPGSNIATLGLAQVELLSRVHGLQFSEVLARGAAEPSDVALQIQCADIEIALGEYQSSFNRLIELVKIADADSKKVVREHLVGLFTLIDPADPILLDARKQLANALF